MSITNKHISIHVVYINKHILIQLSTYNTPNYSIVNQTNKYNNQNNDNSCIRLIILCTTGGGA